MLGLTINNLQITATTNGGNFTVNLPFTKGLNVIRAENSSGKSTCMNAIAYGLGLEAILGPIRKSPFPKSLYKEIYDNKIKQTPFFVSTSFICLTITNSDSVTATLKRDILGDENKVTIEIENKKEDYFLGSAGKVGSSISERGFHYWLEKFIGWELPSVVTFEDKEATLYLECIFPLFFIEQKRGWSEIQANIPTHYSIKNVKKAAAEFCLGIDSFEYEKELAKYKNKIEKAGNEWEKIISSTVAISEFNSVHMNTVPPIEKYEEPFGIEFFYREGDALISVYEQERALNKLVEGLSKDVELSVPDNDKMREQRSILRALRRELEENENSVELTMITVAETESKLSTLRHDLDQYQQLKRLKNVGSKIEEDLQTQKCPICESDLYDTLGNRALKRQPMTLEENIEFLKNQIDFFETIRGRNIEQLEKFRALTRLLQSKIELEDEKLAKLREDIDDINGTTKSLIRSKIQAEIELKEVTKLKKTLDEQKKLATKAHTNWTSSTNSLKILRKEFSGGGKTSVINPLEAIIRTNLSSFGFDPSAISSISISPQTLRPEQEGYNIVAETSASDYVRIIWSYTLALLEFAAKQKSIKHGGFVVFDEPRQHEASKVSFSSLIGKASESLAYGGQAIFATSMDKAELEKACEKNDVNLMYFDDYILSLEPETEETEETEKQ